MKRHLIIAVIIVGVLFLVFSVRQTRVQARSAAPSGDIFKLAEKPVEGWIVCQDLGIGPVPGLPQPRQRVRLCYETSWTVNTYCLRPNQPVPILGTTCTRTSEDEYWCGNGLQPLKEYRIVQAPTDTPTVTLTSTPAPTSTPTPAPTETPTPKPTQRPPPGGDGFKDVLRRSFLGGHSLPVIGQVGPELPTPTPFRPVHPTTVFEPGNAPYILAPTEAFTSPVQPVQNNFDLHILDSSIKARIKIAPDHKLLNRKPVVLNFRPDSTCAFGDGNACINQYLAPSGGAVTFVTVHSGIGGEAQGLRHALEGTGFDQAGLPLRQVKKNLDKIINSSVTLSQGNRTLAGLEIAAAVRLPAGVVRQYIATPVNQALAFAAQYEPELLAYLHSSEPLLVIETCGWRMPGEAEGKDLPDSSASIYLLVIRLKEY